MSIAALAVAALAAAAAPSPSPSPSPSPAAGASLAERTAFYAVFLDLGPGWIKDRAPGEQPAMREHAAHMNELSASRRIVLGGPFIEDALPPRPTGAMVVLATADAAEARRIMESDPGVKAGTFVIRDVRRFAASTGAWRPWHRPGS